MINQAEAKVLFESDRFQAKFIPEPNSGCWIWTGSCCSDGYGRIWCAPLKTKIGAHQVAYIAKYGPVPHGMELDHFRCNMRCCINPDHIEPVTHLENIRRGRSYLREQTHCAHGHEFTPENTIWHKNHTVRRCRTCHNLYKREWRARGKL